MTERVAQPPAPARDPGLQPERTALAWFRTGLSFLVNALLALKAGVQSGQPALVALGVSLLVASLGTAAVGSWREHRLLRRAERAGPPAIAMLATTLGVLCACAAAFGTALWMG